MSEDIEITIENNMPAIDSTFESSVPSIEAEFENNTPSVEANFDSDTPDIEADFAIWVNEAQWGNIRGDVNDQTDLKQILDSLQESKVDKTDESSKVYGTDANGDQTLYDLNSFGQVDDVQMDGVSVVTNKIAELGTMAGENASDYSTTAVADTLYADISYEETINNHIADKDNPHEVTKDQVGLGNVDNTSDLNKPISTATQTALDGKQDTISDLSTIRENAQHGESAYNTISGYGDIVTHDVDEFATAAQGALADTAVQPNDLATVATSGSYSDLLNKPTIGNATLTIQKNGTNIDSFTANATTNKIINVTVPTTASDVGALPDTTTISDLTTTDQQAALNSGATSTNIGQIANNTQAISDEVTNRQNADIGLQNQIDAIVSSSDVFDIVGTYAELQAYDIMTVPVNDIIKVLVDETHSGAATYYRCTESGGVKSWTYIGAEGAYYTKGEADSTFVPQTRTVNSKALSSNITLTASDVGALPDSTVIPTVNNSTITIQKNGTTVQTFTLNQASNATANIAVPTATSDLANDSGFITSADLPTNHVTTDTAQDITGTKTFVGQKKIGFKQSSSSDKLGFTLYNNSNVEKGYLEYNPSNLVDNVPLMTLGNYTSTSAGQTHIGFRKYSSISGETGAYNLLAPLVKDARTPFSLTTTYTNFYLPLGYTNGNVTVTTAKSGVVDISTLLPTKTSDLTNDSGFVTSSALSSDYVTTNTTQTITGVKTLTNALNVDIHGTDARMAAKFEDISLGTSPSADYFAGFTAQDSNGTYYASADCIYRPDGTVGSNLWAKQGGVEGFLGVYVDGYGTVYTRAPTPATADNSTKIATTAYVKAQGYTSNVGTVTSVNNTSPDGNGNVSISIPTVNNATLTIQKNSTNVATFTANASSNVTANISVPTKVSDLSNDSGFITGINSSDVTTALGYTPANDSNVVKTTGDQTIAGDKTFTGYIKGQPANSTNHAIKLGSNGVDYMDFFEYGGLWNFYKSRSGTNTLVGKIAELTTSTNDETLATTNWVNSKGYALDSDVVKTTGNQSIGGTKTFSSAAKFAAYNGIIILGTDHYYQMRSSGGTPEGCGLFLDNDTSKVAFSAGTSTITIGSSAITPQSITQAASDNSTKIATTAFVNNWVTANTSEVAVVVESWQSTTEWYRIWSDGWIEQGGFIEISSANTWTNKTLHKAMADSYYDVKLQTVGSSTSTFTLKAGNSSTNTSTVLKILSSSANAGVRWSVRGQGA